MSRLYVDSLGEHLYVDSLGQTVHPKVETEMRRLVESVTKRMNELVSEAARHAERVFASGQMDREQAVRAAMLAIFEIAMRDAEMAGAIRYLQAMRK